MKIPEMSQKKIKDIKSLAECVRNILFSSSAIHNNGSIAFRIKKILGINILYTDYDAVDGYVRWNSYEKKPEIVLSRKDNNYEGRQIFTIAHELGHLFLHWKWYPGKIIYPGRNNVLNADQAGKTMYRGAQYNIQEAEADEFAGNLLMPENEVISTFKKLPKAEQNNLDLARIDIASEFDVSYSAVYIRLKNLRERI